MRGAGMQTVCIIDTTLRDGLQHEERYLPLEQRLELVERLIAAGVARLEVGSFAHPVYLPQFKEIDQFAMMLPRRKDVEYTFLALNRRAVERAVELKARGAPIHRVLTGQLATSAAYAKKNMNSTHEELFAEAERSVKLLHAGGIERVCGNVGTIFGCPIMGRVPLEEAYRFAQRLFDMGFDEVEHADTSGEATPDRVTEYFGEILRRWPDPAMHTLHIHDVNGMGMACYYAAMEAGMTQFECTLGGIGGQPANRMDGAVIHGTGDYYYTQGRTGLVCTEDFAAMAKRMGRDGGVDVGALIGAGARLEELLGRRLGSFAVAAVADRETAYDSAV